MNDANYKSIHCIGDYIAWLNQIKSIDAKFAFRGQRDDSWLLDCGALRRMLNLDPPISIEDPHFLDAFIDYHRNKLLAPARNYDFATDNGRQLGDLELLAKLQHVGAATCLFDFTKDALVALWVACEQTSASTEVVNGQVFAIQYTNRVHFREITLNETRQIDKIGDILRHLPTGTRSSMSWYWEPALIEDVVPRLLRQHSLFVFGHARLPSESVESITITGDAKKEILDQLERQYDISAESLFPDLHGFARYNDQHSSLQSPKSSNDYLYRGIQAYNFDNFEASIQDVDQAIYIRPQATLSYFVRAHARTALARERDGNRSYYRKAVEDYDAALQNLMPRDTFRNVDLRCAILRNKANAFLLIHEAQQGCRDATYEPSRFPVAVPYPSPHRATPAYVVVTSSDLDTSRNKASVSGLSWISRNALAEFDDLERSCQVYTECIDAAQDNTIDVSSVYYNRANGYFKRERWHDAQSDYEAAIAHNQEFRDAHFNLGNTHVKLENYNAATQSFSTVLNIEGGFVKALLNRAASFALLGKFEAAVQDYTAAGATGARLQIVQEAVKGRPVVGHLPFDGNAGNVGNIGFSTKPALRGGKGAGGDSWFLVTFYSGEVISGDGK